MAKTELKESQIQKAIKEYLEYTGWLVWRHQNVGIFKQATNSYIPVGTKGICDLFALKNSLLLGIEVKRKSGEQSPDQKEWQRRFEKAGGRYILARSIDDIHCALGIIRPKLYLEVSCSRCGQIISGRVQYNQNATCFTCKQEKQRKRYWSKKEAVDKFQEGP